MVEQIAQSGGHEGSVGIIAHVGFQSAYIATVVVGFFGGHKTDAVGFGHIDLRSIVDAGQILAHLGQSAVFGAYALQIVGGERGFVGGRRRGNELFECDYSLVARTTLQLERAQTQISCAGLCRCRICFNHTAVSYSGGALVAQRMFSFGQFKHGFGGKARLRIVAQEILQQLFLG